MVIDFLKGWFGDFTKKELVKFLFLGVIFAFIIGIYWSLRVTKDSIFMSLVGGGWLPAAKIVSLITLLPLVIVYSKLLDRFPRHKMLYTLCTIYFVLIMFFGFMLSNPSFGIANMDESPYRILGWAWYIFVESYGSLLVALFWSFSADITKPEAAKRGFPLALMFGQIGSMGLPYLAKTSLNLEIFSNSLPIIFILGGLILFIMVLVWLFMRVMSEDQLTGYEANIESQGQVKKERTGFLEGLRLMLSQPYLLGIFSIYAFFEIITTIVDFNFKLFVKAKFAGEGAVAAYLGNYAVWVNFIAFLCLFFGISNIQRRLGVGVSLVMMPIIVAGYFSVFKFFPQLAVLFWVMVIAKAIHYSLNNPALKQLYVPTSRDAKYKAQAWIETFGSRGSKGVASAFNLSREFLIKRLGSAQGVVLYLGLSAFFAYGLIALWVFVALYLGRKYEKAVRENKVVC